MPGVSPDSVHRLAHQLQVLRRVDQGVAMSSLMTIGPRSDLAPSGDLAMRIGAALNTAVDRAATARLTQRPTSLAAAAPPMRLRDVGVDRRQCRAFDDRIFGHACCASAV